MCNQLALLAEFDSGGVVRMFPTMCSFVGRSTGMNYEYVFVLMVFFALEYRRRTSKFVLIEYRATHNASRCQGTGNWNPQSPGKHLFHDSSQARETSTRS